MKIGFDIGGVLSKDKRWRNFANFLHYYGAREDIKVFIITDIHDREDIRKILCDNGMGWFPCNNVYSADYTKYGEACKAILLKELEIDIFFDDFIGYLQWDSQLGKAPLRCLVMPDMFQPYWSSDWKCSGGDFGRRVASEELK